MAIKLAPLVFFVLQGATMCAAAPLVFARPAFAQAVPAPSRMTKSGVSFVPPAPGYRPVPPATIRPPYLVSYTGPLKGGYVARISITQKPAQPGEKADAAAIQALVTATKDIAPNYKKIASGGVKVGGSPALFVYGTFTTTWGEKIKTKEIIVKRGESIYGFRFGADDLAYKKQVRVFDKMVANVKWR